MVHCVARRQCTFYEDQIALYDQDSETVIAGLRSTLGLLTNEGVVLHEDVDRERASQALVERKSARFEKRLTKALHNATFYVDVNNNIQQTLRSIAPNLIKLQEALDTTLRKSVYLKSHEVSRLQSNINSILSQLWT